MNPESKITGLTVPLNWSNIDTDAIIPKQFMKSLTKNGLGNFLFDELRYLDCGELGMDCSLRPQNPDFPMNNSRYRDASILIAGENFGCGSSREHAVWALLDYGIKAILAPSFSDIFMSNCIKNALPCIELPAETIGRLASKTELMEGYTVSIDLLNQTIETSEPYSVHFSIEPGIASRLINKWNDVDLTLQMADQIRKFEEQHLLKSPWLRLS